jgi:hypothetical protein
MVLLQRWGGHGGVDCQDILYSLLSGHTEGRPYSRLTPYESLGKIGFEGLQAAHSATGDCPVDGG